METRASKNREAETKRKEEDRFIWISSNGEVDVIGAYARARPPSKVRSAKYTNEDKIPRTRGDVTYIVLPRNLFRGEEAFKLLQGSKSNCFDILRS